MDLDRLAHDFVFMMWVKHEQAERGCETALQEEEANA